MKRVMLGLVCMQLLRQPPSVYSDATGTQEQMDAERSKREANGRSNEQGAVRPSVRRNERRAHSWIYLFKKPGKLLG
jgi:hypothetical protein